MRISDWSSDVCSSDLNNPVALSIISTMRPDLPARIGKQANWRERDTAPQLGEKGQWRPKGFAKAEYSIELVLQATKGQTLSIATELRAAQQRLGKEGGSTE